MIYYIGGQMLTVITRRWGDIPGCIPESEPTSKNVELQQKYNIGPNDPQWVYEMCERIENTFAERIERRKKGEGSHNSAQSR